MSPRSQTVVVVMALLAAFALYWFHRDGGATFIAFISGSPIGAAAVAMTKKAADASKPAGDVDNSSSQPQS